MTLLSYINPVLVLPSRSGVQHCQDSIFRINNCSITSDDLLHAVGATCCGTSSQWCWLLLIGNNVAICSSWIACMCTQTRHKHYYANSHTTRTCIHALELHAWVEKAGNMNACCPQTSSSQLLLTACAAECCLSVSYQLLLASTLLNWPNIRLLGRNTSTCNHHWWPLLLNPVVSNNRKAHKPTALHHQELNELIKAARSWLYCLCCDAHIVNNWRHWTRSSTTGHTWCKLGQHKPQSKCPPCWGLSIIAAVYIRPILALGRSRMLMGLTDDLHTFQDNTHCPATVIQL